MAFVVGFILLAFLVEVMARIFYFKVHGLPYICKKIGEYPYNEFVEACGPPLHWRLKPGYRKGAVSINSLGLRSPEPIAGRKRIWVVGESELFGAKLASEENIWFRELQKLLDQSAYDYQVMNGSVIGYNLAQTTHLVDSLPLAKGDVLILRPNQNDVSLAYIHGSDWEEGTTWPMAFIHKLERHRVWYLKLMDRSCFAGILRRRLSKGDGRASAFKPKPGFQWQNLLAYQERNLRDCIASGQQKGANVAFFDFSPSYGEKVHPGDEPKLSAIQANWRELVEGWSTYQFGIVETCIEQVAIPLALPVLRTRRHIWGNPDRYRLYHDLVHFNEQGHKAMAQALYEELLPSGLLVNGCGS